MITRRLSAGLAMVCVLSLVCLLAAAGAVWAETYSLSKEIKEGFSFGSLAGPIDVDIAPDGKMIIADQSNRRVLLFDEYGDFFFGCLFPTGFFPVAVSVDNTGSFYYISRFKGSFGSDVIKLPISKSCSSTTLADPPGGFGSPRGLSVGADGSVYMADTDNNRVVKHNASGAFVAEWGVSGNGDGEFHNPEDVAVHGSGVVLVADTGNDRIQGFAANGSFLGQAGTTGTGQLQFNSPRGLAVGPDSAVYVSDTGNNRVQKGFLDGTFGGIFGDTELNGPDGLAVDTGGNVSVADNFNDRIAVYTPDVIVFDKGAASKVVTMPAPVSLTVDIQPDSYWNGVPAEMFAGAGGAAGLVYLSAFPLTGTVADWALFSSFLDIRPFLTFNVTALSDIAANLLNNSTGLPADWTVVVCLDRNINGIYNPASSVCDSIDVTIQ